VEQPGAGGIQVGDLMPLADMENILIRQALARYGDSVEGKKKAAQALNISLATLYNKLKNFS
jgi:transcriptional regulator with PAS, ATPase and Fis domain